MNEVAAKILYRLVLPLTLFASCLLRYNGLSLVYLVCLLLVPLISSPSRNRSSASIVLQCVTLGVSSLFVGAHLIFQIVLVSYQPYGHFIQACTEAADLAFHFGFHRYDECNVIDVVRLLAPDVAVFFVSLITLLSSRKLSFTDQADDNYEPIEGNETPSNTNKSFRFESVLPILVGIMFLVAGIMLPNALAAVYFLTFLTFGILWAFHLCTQTNNSKIFYFKVFLALYSALHVLLIYLYQLVFFQDALSPDQFVPRLLGLPAIVNSTDCNRRLELHINIEKPWPSLVYPFMVFLLYWLLAVEHRMRLKKKFSNSVVEKINSPWWHPKSWSQASDQPLITDNPPKNQYGSVVTADEITLEQVNEPVQFQSTFSSFFMFLMRQSYIAALIVMMAWSIFYHSWLTFVLLLWACLTWITPFARWFCMVSSPYLVIYVDLLLIIQYIYGINFTESELPTKIEKFNFLELGLNHPKYPVIPLAVQTMFSWVFLVTLRQHRREKKTKQRKAVSSDGEMVLSTIARPLVQAFRKRYPNIDEIDQAAAPSNEAKEMILILKSILSKYWILVCCAAFLLVALQNAISLYQIFYMVIFLMGFIVYQFSLRTWKLILRPLWWFMVIYSIIILLTIYTYQFENMPQHWYNGTHLSDQWLFDLGLRQQTKTHLLLELLIPTIFSIVIVVQLHFFHKPLIMKINRILRCRKRTVSNNVSSITPQSNNTDSTLASTQTVTIDSTSNPIDEEDLGPKTPSEKLFEFYHGMTVVLWRFVEIHMPKIVCFVVMLVVIQQVSAINAILIIFLALAMPSEYIQKLLNYVIITWSSIVVMVYMFYQLQFVTENMLDANCTNAKNISTKNSTHFASNAWWLGFHKSDSVSTDVRGYLFIIIVIVFQKVVKHHQELYRYREGIKKHPPSGILFPDVTRNMADESISSCLKYLCNNFFTLFGLEVNLMVMVLCMGLRADSVAVLHSLWVFLFLILRRKKSAKIWSFYIIYLSISLPVQYLLILGWPPGLCKGYPWDNLHPTQLIHWLFLTSVEKPQDPYILLVDYFQFLVACCQANVFLTESVNKKVSESFVASGESTDRYTPPDFMNNKTWLDLFKILLLDQFLWVTLTIVYVTAQNTTSLFNSGFIVGCFFFLWHGQGLYLRPRKTMKRWWKMLIAYNFFVIVAKVWLQLVSCVFIQDILKSTDCYLIQLLNLYCIRPNAYDEPIVSFACETKPDSGLLLDAICFIVVMIQYRIFRSSYFKYVVREHRRQAEMANRGAQLVEERLQVRLKESIQRDQRKMKMIKDKVAKLKKRLEELNPYAKEPLSHYEAIYAGDYYLFEETDSESDSEYGVTEDGGSTSYALPKQTSELLLAEEKEDPEHIHVEDDYHETADTVEYSEPHLSQSSDEPENSLSRDGLRLRRKSKSHNSHLSTEGMTPLNNESSATLIDNESYAEKNGETFTDKIKELAQSISNAFENMANVAIKFFNDCSSDYRYIASQLNVERRERARTVLENNRTASNVANKDSNSDLQSSSSSNGDKESENDTWSLVQYDDQESWKRKNFITVQLAVAFYYALLAHTDLLCYSLMIINHIYYASALSMPLPFFVFLWGMLSIPRPTKRFWIAIITYVELTIVVKYVFQFQLPEDKNLNFNECSYYDPKEAKSPLCPPRIIGIERNQYSSACDLLLLLGLFFHRFALKAHGLWREKAWGDEEDSTPGTSRLSAHKTHDHSGATGLQHEQPSSNITSEITQNQNWTNDTLATSGSRVSGGSRRKKTVMYNIRRFIYRMLDPDVGTGAVDVYAWMFGAQFIVFIIILSSWSAFSSNQESNSNFAKIIEENVVPKTFLYLLLTQFLLMVFDRYLYMRKMVFAKLIYLAILLFVFHIFLFIVVPDLTQIPFTRNIPAIFLYLFECIYFGLSAYQVRCGYPTRILGNFLTKRYTVTSGILFQGIQAIPFLLELRSVLDWVCTKTTLTLNHWLKVEDIYANVFILKCWRDSEKTWPHPRGMAYWTSSKWFIGGLLVVLLIVVIWFPLLFMSFVNSAFIANKPVEVTCTLTVGGYQPLFKVATQQQLIMELSSDEINDMLRPSHHVNDPNWDQQKAEQMMEEYKKKGNIMRIKVLSNSSAIWTISPPSRDNLIQYLETSNTSITLRFKYEFSREPDSATIVQETVSGVTTKTLKHGDEIRTKLAQVLKQSTGDGKIVIPKLFPTYIQVPASGSIKFVDWLGHGSFVTATLVLRRGSTPQMNSTQVEWWEIIQDHPKPIFGQAGPGFIEIIALNDLVPPLHLSFFASKGIIGLYVGFVWLVGKFVRLFFTSISYRIMFDELPNVDRLLKLCLEIYMVRESKELKLEEDLIAKLLFLYRSPETLIKWTKYKRLKVS